MKTMGVTIECEKTGTGYDMGYGGFGNFREKVAELYNKAFSEHYNKLGTSEMMCFDETERRKMFEEYDRETEKLIKKYDLNIAIIDFLMQPDGDGQITPETCKMIYDVIKDYDDDICYGYAGRPDCTMFKHLKLLFLECYENNSEMVWG